MNPSVLPEKITRGVKETNKQMISQTLGFISSAFVLVAALAWNEAIKAVITAYFKAGSGLISLVIYAVLVTLIAVVITSRLNKITEKFKDENPE